MSCNCIRNGRVKADPVLAKLDDGHTIAQIMGDLESLNLMNEVKVNLLIRNRN